MTLTRVTPDGDAECTKFDIVAVPAIGANPFVTFRYPGHPKPNLRNLKSWKHMFSDVKGARVFLYTFDTPQDAKTYGITKYAEDLLRDMAKEDLGSDRPLHLAGHSTGGIVIKRALVVANGSNRPEILQIKRKCISLAFFGTPHHGSTVLCSSTYKQTIADILGLEFPMSDRLRHDLLNIEDIDDVVHFSHVFQPLTINMERIWSFYETMDSQLQVRARASGSTGMTNIWRLVVERRSAALDGAGSSRYPSAACEALFPINADHENVVRFGDNPGTKAFAEYTTQLQYNNTTIAETQEGLDARWLEHKLRVQVHRFHDLDEDNQTAIKLWSVYPSLYQLLEEGPESCLNDRVAAAVHHPTQSTERNVSRLPDGVHSADCDLPRTGVGIIKPMLRLNVQTGDNSTQIPEQRQEQHPPLTASTLVDQEDHSQSRGSPSQNSNYDEDAQSDISTPSAYSLPERSRFRWIHIPCNNLIWVEKIFLAVEREREERKFNQVAESTPNSADLDPSSQRPNPGGLTLTETPTEILENVLENPLASHLLKAKERVEASNLPAPALKDALMNPQEQLGLLKLSQNVATQKKTNLIPEAAQLVAEVREKRVIVSAVKEQMREGHLPDPAFIANKLREDREQPKLSTAVLDEDYWTRKQTNSRHGLPHGRYMEPFSQLFLPKESMEMESIIAETIESYLAPIPSPIEAPQLCLYMPYLSWDTFGGLEVRNSVVERRLKNPVSFVRNRAIESAPSMENKLIWQYLVDTSDLPLHIRRTLDQFGDPHLEAIQTRDQDQVLYKCTKPPDEDPLTREIFHSNKNRASRKEEAKVLMVDQLWCWIIDSDTVTTFFTPKEDLAAKGNPSVRPRSGSTNNDAQGRHGTKVYGPGNFLYQLYNDVNGDQRFANKCLDPFDFVALTVWHAITVFLEKTTDKDLEVFTLFEERLCELVEFRNKSFKAFRDSQIDASEIFQQVDHKSASSTKFQTIIQALNPSYDLTAHIELYDIQNELKMIDNLFTSQAGVVNDLIHAYEILDRTKAHGKHGQAIRWLREGKLQVERYRARVKSLCTDTADAIEEYKTLLDMKQKQSNVIEAYFGRIAAQTQGKQNRSILIFTIFTIIFLPLSFFTSLFSMNVREWTGTETNKTLHTVLALMVPVSVCIIMTVLFLAFNRPIVEGTRKTAKKTVKSVQNGHKHFQRLRAWWAGPWIRGEKKQEDVWDESAVASEVERGSRSLLGSRQHLEDFQGPTRRRT